MTYFDMVNDGLEYIDSHIDEELSFTELSGRYYLSRFHFYRIFRALTGYTVREYVDKRRLTKGIDLLKTTNLTILDIAIACGIHSHEVFTRKFRKEYSLTPSQFRKQSKPLPNFSPIVLIERDFINKNNDLIVPYTIETVEAFTLWGKACNNGYADERDPDTVGHFLYDFADQCFIKHPKGHLILGTLYLDRTTGMIDYFVGFDKVPLNQNAYEHINFQKSDYAVFSYKGVFRQNIRAITNDIYKAVALSNLTIKDINVAFFELYDINYPVTGEFQLLVPIQPSP